ncbi:MAG: hypothetical protein ACP5OA_04165 [Candidatus Woesearchaeota archaeon]
MIHKRGQYASNAAAFVAVLTVLIILYILFLPPDIRTELLGDANSSFNDDSKSNSNNKVLLQQNVGRITYINTNEKTYDLPATRIYSPTSGQVLKNVPSISLRNALFDTEKSKYDIELNIDRDATKNVLLSFNVREARGPLSISLNGREIFRSEVTVSNPLPITLNHGDLLDSNTITLITPSPGLTFWRANKYSIENLQVTGDVTDYSNALAMQHFIISQVEKENLESITLYFYPGCNIKDVGSLRIDFNGRTIYSGVADCGTRTFATLNTEDVLSGNNELRFYSSKGSYILDNMYIKTVMKKPAYKTYYFDIEEDYFDSRNNEPRCGDYDSKCPSGCDEVEDADCCFTRNGYWCALPTLNENDRCRFYVATDNCNICKTGYYDRYDDAPDNCEEMCGDNNDDQCDVGCPQPSRYYDKDCCFAQDSDNYWCQETPITGLEDKCKPSVNSGECDLCPSGYVNEDGSRPVSCRTYSDKAYNEREYELSENYELKIIVRFVDDTERKRVDFDINGHTFRIDTTDIDYSKIISDYAEMDTNSIQILPVTDDVDIAEVRVELRKIR